jgi:hypothetical protein
MNYPIDSILYLLIIGDTKKEAFDNQKGYSADGEL